ncbi:MAG: hypothetical protein FWH04_03200 [Oscillospiraceae bacterium]|nr:hypothetical protein [Oscillospiraceae bacterium]
MIERAAPEKRVPLVLLFGSGSDPQLDPERQGKKGVCGGQEGFWRLQNEG